MRIVTIYRMRFAVFWKCGPDPRTSNQSVQKVMSVSPTSSHVYVSYSSIFSQGGNKAMTAFQAASATYANGGVQGSWQVRSASMSALDVLDISPEALEWTKPADALMH